VYRNTADSKKRAESKAAEMSEAFWRVDLCGGKNKGSLAAALLHLHLGPA